MQINNISVNTRHNRPSVLSKTALVTYFINDGQYADPYAISAVSIFKADNNFYPSSVVTSDGEIDQAYSSLVLMNFANDDALCSSTDFDTSNYSAGASGIYRLREGVYAVVLDTAAETAIFNLSGNNEISNRVSATGDYIDVWSVIRTVGSDLDAIVNDFSLHSDRFFAVTEPLLFRVATRLENAYITLGSKVDLKLTNEVTLENSAIDRSIVNLFKESIVIDPAIEIYKENSDRNLPARVVVSSFAQTSATCDVTSENTVVFNFDTSLLASHPSLLDGTLGAMTGSYVVRLKFTALNQVHYSNYLGFVIR